MARRACIGNEWWRREMGEKIALGFHTCVDFELVWNKLTIENMITEYHIQNIELNSRTKTDGAIDSERALLLICLKHMKEGTGVELVPENPQICLDFANRFQYSITIGGTATRAAIAISKIGYESAIQMCCFNRHIKKLLPKEIHYFSSVGEGREEVYPHVDLQYQAGVCIKANDIDFTTPRENRILFSRDIDSMNMEISQDFSPMIAETEVFLLSCFSEILNFDILKDRMIRTSNLLRTLPENALVVMEDGCYINKEFRYYVHHALREVVDVLSMNEDELQDYIGHKIDILNPDEVLQAVKSVYQKAEIPLLLVHSASWALAYGQNAAWMRNALEGGITMASTRFWFGDDFGRNEYQKVKELPAKAKSIEFCASIEQKGGSFICCRPSKDLQFVKNPTVVGLGDFFAGGLLPELLIDRRR
jgi:ADP-dependent phosphofructokinase/glucokinase